MPETVVQVMTGAISGAAAGALAGLVVGPTKAEREERGKRRLQARIEIGAALKAFRYQLAMARLLRLERQPADEDAVLKMAYSLAHVAYSSAPLFGVSERWRLRRSVASLVGAELVTMASLQPDPVSGVSDAALAAVTAKYRRSPEESLRHMISKASPLSAEWDRLTKASDRLTRRYP
jgi:hypothetical protein